ncbi:MAG: DUF1097 domain-containing protein [Anaerolineae bacterium]|nr:DUF1097 domain-containing protein [Anaerolineae bacterium]
MAYLVAVGISAGVIGGLCAQFAGSFNVVAWVCFVAMACFFAAGGKNSGFLKNVPANLSGVLWAMMIFTLLGFWQFQFAMFLAVLIAVTIACVQAKWSVLSFIPGTFVGMACTFGTNGDWVSTVIALIIGSCMGWLAEQGGHLLLKAYTGLTQKGSKQTA